METRMKRRKLKNNNFSTKVYPKNSAIYLAGFYFVLNHAIDKITLCATLHCHSGYYANWRLCI